MYRTWCYTGVCIAVMINLHKIQLCVHKEECGQQDSLRFLLQRVEQHAKDSSYKLITVTRETESHWKEPVLYRRSRTDWHVSLWHICGLVMTFWSVIVSYSIKNRTCIFEWSKNSYLIVLHINSGYSDLMSPVLSSPTKNLYVTSVHSHVHVVPRRHFLWLESHPVTCQCASPTNCLMHHCSCIISSSTCFSLASCVSLLWSCALTFSRM